MADRPDLKCAECTRCGRPCESMSWSALDRTREKLKKNIEREEAEREALLTKLTESTARVSRKRKVLEQAEKREQKKFPCLVKEVKVSDKDVYATFREPTN